MWPLSSHHLCSPAWQGEPWRGAIDCKYLFNVADIWPESAVELGALRNRALIWLAERLEWTTYRRAGAIWAVTDTIRAALVRRGLPDDKVFALPTGVDVARFQPRDQARARAELGWQNCFTVVFAGTIGLAQGLATALDTAELLRAVPDIHFMLVGDGAARAELAAEARRRGLPNVTFTGALPSDQMPVVLAASDVVLVSLRNLPVFNGALPTKMYEAMACARPILLAVGGEARRMAEDQAHAALYVEPENPAAWAESILRLRQSPALGQQLGANGRAFAQAQLDREQMTSALERRILALVTANAAQPVEGPTSPVLTGRQP